MEFEVAESDRAQQVEQLWQPQDYRRKAVRFGLKTVVVIPKPLVTSTFSRIGSNFLPRSFAGVCDGETAG